MQLFNLLKKNISSREIVENDIVEKYLELLKNKYLQTHNIEKWTKFETVKEGISNENKIKLRKIYPDIPASLIRILEFADGTFHRIYGTEKINLYFLGSDIDGYPYYLLSSNDILDNQNLAFECYSEDVDRIYGEDYVDDKIIRDSKKMHWLHFSDCMNNGGSSQLFIDFSPSKNGKKGQIIRVIHDLDEIKVIADSFDEYLKMLIDNDLNFINNK